MMKRLSGIFLVSLLTLILVPMETYIYAEQDIFDPSHMIVESPLPGQIDPASIYGIPAYELGFNVYEPLISLDKDKMDSFAPKLATSWQISADGLTYRFTIRQGVKFHNGDLLTTEDVEYSFERIMVTDYGQWMSWLFYQALFGLPGSQDEYGNTIILGSQINDAITRDGTTVTFHLPAPYPPFMQVVAGFGFVVNKEWCVNLGEWPGTWDNWTAYNRRPSIINEQDTEPPGPHVNAMCGTGPFKLDYILSGVECSIVKFNDYWGQWPAPGTNGTLERVTFRSVKDWTTRKAQFLAGELDTIQVPSDRLNEVLGQDGVRCVYPLPLLECDAALFNFNISSASPYVGIPGGLPSGTFNESGIPLDFFADVNVRKGFAYAFNYSQLIDEALGGDASQPATPFIPEMPFYDPTVPKYSPNLTAAEESIRRAWNGSLWTNGFNFTLCYNQGNIVRQKTCEILKTNIESLNPKFHVNIYSPSNYYDESLTHMLTVWIVGWLADFADPHDMALAFMKSGINFPDLQSYKNTTVDSLIDQGFTITNSSERQQIYHELQVLYHEDCPSVPLYQPRGRRIERNWVQGWVYNPILQGMDYFYSEWKEPSLEYAISPGDNVIDATATADIMVFINTTTSGKLSLSTHNIASVGTIGECCAFHSIKCVTVDTTVPPEDIIFPIEVRVYYIDQEVVSAYIDQSTLCMSYWNGRDWISENDTGAVTPSDVLGYTGYVWARIWHLSEFAAMGQQTPIHAVAPKSVRLTKTFVGQGFKTEILVDAFNQGDYEETFNISVYANDTLIGSFTNLTLSARNSATISILGDTSSLAKGTYTLVAVADPVPGENATADNNVTAGPITVTILGDITGPAGWPDDKVDMRDVGLVARNFGETVPPAPANCDLTGPTPGVPDGKIDMRDIGLVARHFGENYP